MPFEDPRAEIILILRLACIRNEQNSSRIPAEEILRAVCRARSTAPRPFCKQRYAAGIQLGEDLFDWINIGLYGGR